MSTITDRTLNEARKRLLDLRKEITSIDWKQMIERWGGDGANPVGTILHPIIELFLELTKSDEALARLNTAGVGHILSAKVVGHLQSLLGAVRAIDQVAPQAKGAAEQDLIGKLIQALPDLLPPLASCLILEKSFNGERMTDEFDQLVRLRANMETAHVELRDVQKQAKETLDATRAAAFAAGILTSSKAISASVRNHRKLSCVWLGAAAALSTTLLLIVVLTMTCSSGPPRPDLSWTVAANLGHFATRALGVTVLSFMLVVAVRSYRSERHNQIANKQRLDALATFEKFKAAAKETVEDAVLLQATEAIFSPQPTGFVDKDTGGATHVSELLRVMKSARD